MRTKLAIAGIAAAIVGCSTVQQEQFHQVTCDTALAAWTAYQVALTNGVAMSSNVVIAAQVAAPFLASYCGWYAPKHRGAFGTNLVDTNGVLVIYPPAQ